MAYITQANAARTVRKVDKDKLVDLVGDIYEQQIFSVFNDREEKELLLFQELFREPISFINNYFVKFQRIDTKQYVKEGKPPAYHTRADCERLLSDYENYRIPAPIQAKGDEEIERFRAWFLQNESLLSDNPERFRIKLSNEFDISPLQIEHVRYDNSGPEKFINISLEDARRKINGLIVGIDEWCQADGVNMDIIVRWKYGEKTYLKNKPIKVNRTPYDEKTIHRVLTYFDDQFKHPLHEYLILYYKVKYNPGLSFEKNLLDQLGFRQCRACSQ